MLTASEYARVFERPQRASDRWFTLLWRANGRGKSRLGLAISKKNCRRAVDRNLIKRMVRESFRRHRGRLPAVDVVVLTRRGIDVADRTIIRESLQRHWQRLSLLNVEPAGE